MSKHTAANNPQTVATAEPTRWQLSKWMISVTRPVLGPLLASTLCRLLDQLLGIALLVLPAVMLIYSPGYQLSAWYYVIGAMVVMAIAKGLLRYGEQFLGHFVAFKALELLRGEVYNRLYPQAPAIMNQTYSGDLLSRITRDIDRIEVFFAHTFAPVISAIVIPVTVIATVTHFDLWLGIICFLIYLTAFLTVLGGGQYESSQRALKLRGRITQHLTDSIHGVAEVIGYGNQARRLEGETELESKLESLSKKRGASLGYSRALIASVRMIAVVVLIVVGLYQVDQTTPDRQEFTVALVVAAVFAVVRSWEVINGVADLMSDLNNSFAAARRIWDIRFAGLELPEGDAHLPVCEASASEALLAGSQAPEATGNQNAGPSGKPREASPIKGLRGREIRWENVTFTYPPSPGRPQGTPAIADANLVAQAGRVTALVGATGSGKSTLTKLALRYYDPQRGTITVDGVDLKQLPLEELRGEVALVTQEIRMFNNTVAWNLRLANPAATDEELWEVLRVAGLDDEIRAFPKGLETPVGERGQSVSGGQRQRLSLAQALLRRCPVLILDEFTAHLDPALATRVRGNLRAYLPDATIIEVTHRLEHLHEVDWVAVIDGGRIVEQGTPSDLMGQKGALFHLVNRDL